MENYLFDIKYDRCRQWIKDRRNDNIDWDSLKFAGKKSKMELQDFLNRRKAEGDFPKDLDINAWFQLVEQLKETEQQKEELNRASLVASLKDNTADSEAQVPTDEHSAWQLYRKRLIEVNGFAGSAVDSIEQSCISILKRLRNDTTTIGPVQGLVLGNVQSGKTANIAGLMAMAADHGWNMFIVLSGTIESLRNQTQNRLFHDLQSQIGSLQWQQLDNPSKRHSGIGYRTCDLHFGESNYRYITVCLKQSTRLRDLIEWLQADRNTIQQMKVIVIDDEADQASINTGDIHESNERKTINRLILNLVNCRDHKAKTKDDNHFIGHYAAMDYISYTATPYANCLNESGENTLYPKDFIQTLPISNEYFGVQQLFGGDDPESSSLDIIRDIDKKDVDIIKKLNKDETVEIPSALQQAILWFICAASVMRYFQYKKPVSMLVHTSSKQPAHEAVTNQIREWLIAKRDTIPNECKELYHTETNRFTKVILRESFPQYGIPDDQIWDYPKFDDIKPYIIELVSKVTSIRMSEDGDLNYTKNVNLCIDDCKQNGINDEGYHMRLAYPDELSANKPDFSTAFIIVGGNTLSRGLTLQGLVSTFFIRSVQQADTLMQMGRWFGYRKHYELLPRVWMTQETVKQYEFLSELDNDLRKQLYQMSLSGRTPLDFGLSIKTSPQNNWLKIKITTKKKMQSAEVAEVDFSGMEPQLTVYSKDENIQLNNINVTDQFLASLDQPVLSESTKAYIWNDVPFEVIKRDFFDRGFMVPETSRSFNMIDPLMQWISHFTSIGKIGKWRIIVSGISIDENTPEEKIWKLPQGYKIGKVSRTVKHDNGDTINIGVLSAKKDYVADITESQLGDDDWKRLLSGKDLSSDYQEYRKLAGVENIPLFIIYRLNKDAKARAGCKTRTDLHMKNDLIGITMVTPGIRLGNSVTRVKISNVDKDTESELNDEN